MIGIYAALYLILLGVFGYIYAELPKTSPAKTIIQVLSLTATVVGCTFYFFVTGSILTSAILMIVGYIAFDIGKDISTDKEV